MKISNEEVSRLLAYRPTERTGNRQETGASTSAVHADPRHQDAATVDVSSAAQEIMQVKRLVNELPDVRADRVQELKAQIDNGTYHVSGDDIADLIIRRTLADNTAL